MITASPVSVARQATFNTAPADVTSAGPASVRRGGIDIPVVEDTTGRASSPIYATGPKPYTKVVPAKIQAQYRRRYDPKATGPPSNVGDSELEILSDVGIAGDSDTDVPPLRTPLSLSALKRIRKEPRIKVPSVKVDSASTAPTIQEETTLDIIAVQTPVQSDTDTDALLPQDHPQNPVSTHTDGDEHISNKNKPNLVDVEEEDVDLEPLDSSFCESDWQPKALKHPVVVNRIPPNDTRLPKENTAVVEDNKVIHKKYERDVKPVFNARLDLGKRWTTGQRPNSTGKSAENKTTRLVRRRSAEDTSNHTEQASETPGTFKETTVSRIQTPVVTDFLHPLPDTDLDPGAVSDWNNDDSVSGIPKPLRVPLESRRREETPHSSDTTRQPPNPPHPTPATMASSDNFEYMSETFEEVLQERNDMIKTERTYQKRIKQLEEELKGMINQCQLLSDENKELRKSLDAAKMSSSPKKGTEEEETKETVALSVRIAKLETEKEILQRSNESLSAKARENDKKMKQFDNVFVENTRLKTKNAELERKMKGIEKHRDALSQRESQSSAEEAGRIRMLEKKYDELKVVLGDVQSENKSLNARIKSLENENKMAKDTLEEKRTELSELMRAMGNETQTESDLQESKARLDRTQEEMDNVKGEMEDMKRMLRESEEGRERLRHTVSQRESELKKVKADQENKEKVIVDLRHSLDRSRQEVQRHIEEKYTYRDLEKDVGSLKSRIGSLRTEIESSISENQRLKHDREEANRLIDRLHQENATAAEAVTDSKRYFRKWEAERESRNKLETDYARKDDEINVLNGQLREAGSKIYSLHGKIKSLEDERTKFSVPFTQETEANNKILKDENKRLRQMLVERNIELTNKNSEQQYIDSRIQTLERKQKDAELRVKHLTGWVSNRDQDNDGPSSTGPDPRIPKNHFPSARPFNRQGRTAGNRYSVDDSKDATHIGKPAVEPKVAYVSPRSRKRGVKRGTHSSMTPPPGWEAEPRKLADGKGSNHTPTSLPSILDSKSMTPPDPHGGYFRLYQDKLRRMRDRQF